MRARKWHPKCSEKGLDCAGLKNAQILALLKHTDANAASDMVADAGDSAAERDFEVESDGAADDSVAAQRERENYCFKVKITTRSNRENLSKGEIGSRENLLKGENESGIGSDET